MICYLVRHGKDDENIRGGWSNMALSQQGIEQVIETAETLAADPDAAITCIFTSDLMRAKQTALILHDKLQVPVKYLPQFREVNNGVLAGMRNDVAQREFPGLFWNTLEWDQCYPNGESPHQFFDRIAKGWEKFRAQCQENNENVILVTHGGVINVILHIENGMVYHNTKPCFPVPYASITSILL